MWWLLLTACDGPTPELGDVRIEPENPVWGMHDLHCVSDADEVRWEVDGTPFEGEVVPADAVRQGRTWTCFAGDNSVSVTPEPLGSNILLFLLDDIGVDKIPVYDALDDAPPQTPVIDGLANEGIRFHRAWSTPVCSTTRSTIMTGRLGRRTGLGRIIDDERPHHILSYDETFIPEMLEFSPLDYDTAVVGKWHLAWIQSQYLDHPGVGAGFDYFAVSMDNLSRAINPVPGRGYFLWEENHNGTDVYRDVYATRRTINQATDLTWNMAEPWFLYVPFNGAHIPYHNPPEELVYTAAVDNSDPERFRAMVESIDIAIGEVLDGMDPDIRARTTVFVVGDNGTAKASTLPELQFAKGSVLESGVRVPFIVAGKGVEAGGVATGMIHTADLFETIAAISGADIPAMDARPEALPRDSKSFLPVFANVEAPTRAFNYTEWFRPNGPGPYAQSDRAISDGRYKLAIREGAINEEFLFDLEDESVDLFESPLSQEALAASTALRAELDRLAEELVYDSPR